MGEQREPQTQVAPRPSQSGGLESYLEFERGSKATGKERVDITGLLGLVKQGRTAADLIQRHGPTVITLALLHVDEA